MSIPTFDRDKGNHKRVSWRLYGHAKTHYGRSVGKSSTLTGYTFTIEFQVTNIGFALGQTRNYPTNLISD